MHTTDQIDYTDPLLGIDKHFEHLPKKEEQDINDLLANVSGNTVEEAKISQNRDKKFETINTARNIIRGEQTLNRIELMGLIQELENIDQFSYATEVLLVRMKLDEARGATIVLKDYETLAKYIYKDHSLPSAFKFKKALQELTSHENLYTTKRCETLGLVGAIYKRKWQFDHQYNNLELAHFYYQRGYHQWREYIKESKDNEIANDRNDQGYNAINYSYINELMAVDSLEQHGRITGFDADIENLFGEAKRTRNFILSQLVTENEKGIAKLNFKNPQPWVYATVAEAYFGLHYYDKALYFIKEYIQLQKAKPWELRGFSQQMFSIAYLQNYCKKFFNTYDRQKLKMAAELEELTKYIDLNKIDECLDIFRDAAENEKGIGNKKGTQSTLTQEIKKEGKTGLALSGGGFRSAMFHIGVLAALAEKDELKNVEIISCVSGGSIIGAYYYLKLKDLLERKTDEQIVKEDYIKIVKEIELTFVSGVQHNLRMRIFSNIVCNFKMFKKNYSRTHRLGELYEEHLFKDLISIHRSDEEKAKGMKDGEIYMSDLFIKPKGVETFSITIDNWHRDHKVPQLVLNATSVNTGHNWQFTASWMGEPPGNIQTDVDVKPRLRRMYYQEAPDPYKNFRLGYAVGASSCVPVMFQPMPLPDLYPGINLELIDGGVHDNQGIGALIEQECKNMIISDGSGQMETNNVAEKNEGNLFFRSDTILQERLRELQFLDIKQRSTTTQINKLVTAHLKNDLENRPISWKFCTDPPRTLMYGGIANNDNDLTCYGILRRMQLYLSQIRTDLDSFHDAESYALMYSGYTQINYDYKNREDERDNDGQVITNSTKTTPDWKFLQIKDYLTRPDKANQKDIIFKEASRVPFKLFYLSRTIKFMVLIGAFALGIGLLSLVFVNNWWNTSLLNVTVKAIVWTIIISLLGVISKVIASIVNVRFFIRKNAIFSVVMIMGWIVCNLYLWFFNGIYNDYGKLEESRKVKKK